MRCTRLLASLAVAAALAVASIACGGGGPLSPSGQVTLRGTVLGGSSAAPPGASWAGARAAGQTVTVSLQGQPSITTTVGPDGSFTLRGLPPGSFTLVFSVDGQPIGTLSFDAVRPNQEITITVDVAGGTVTLVREHRTGIGHGDVEVEGLVEQVLALDPAGESRFVIRGTTVVSRPGQTAIREGNDARSVTDVRVGRRVHVKGVWLTSQGGPLLAHEIKLQGSQEKEEGAGRACMINGGRAGDRIELEGSVAGGNADAFRLAVNGNRASGPVDVRASGGTVFQCHPAGGPNAPSPSQCRASVRGGAKVHVSGQLDACDGSTALVTASKVIVQK